MEIVDIEIWQDIGIPGVIGLYQISTFGRIRSLHYWKLKIRKQLLKHGYLTIILRNNNSLHHYRVNRLMGLVFLWLAINNPKICVCHKDDNPLNNRLDNLFLWTMKENMQDKKLKGRCRDGWGLNKLVVLQYSKERVLLNEWSWINLAWVTLSISPWNISSCCQWKLKSAGWFLWEYKS